MISVQFDLKIVYETAQMILMRGILPGKWGVRVKAHLPLVWIITKHPYECLNRYLHVQNSDTNSEDIYPVQHTKPHFKYDYSFFKQKSSYNKTKTISPSISCTQGKSLH